MWTTDRTVKFIVDLHSQACLWDVSSSDFKNRYIKNNAIDKLSKKYDISHGQVEKKIHNLKCQFRREHKKILDAKKSGCSPKCNWFGYELLQFLLQSNTSKGNRSTDNTDTEIEDNIEKISDVEEAEQPKIKYEPTASNDNLKTLYMSRRLKKRPKEACSTIPNGVQCLQTPSNRASNRDSFAVYGEHVAYKLRACDSAYAVTVAQYHIDNVLYNLGIGTYHKEDNSSTIVPLFPIRSPSSCYSSNELSLSSSPHDSEPV